MHHSYILDWGNLEAIAKNGMKLIFFFRISSISPRKKWAEKDLLFFDEASLARALLG
jgi:hypothetical protein